MFIAHLSTVSGPYQSDDDTRICLQATGCPAFFPPGHARLASIADFLFRPIPLGSLFLGYVDWDKLSDKNSKSFKETVIVTLANSAQSSSDLRSNANLGCSSMFTCDSKPTWKRNKSTVTHNLTQRQLQRNLTNSQLTIKRSVTSRYHGSKISGSQQYFLTETAFSHCETMEETKEKYGLLFCSQVQSCTGKSYMSIFVLFSCHICRTTVRWDSEILLPWQRDATTSPL